MEIQKHISRIKPCLMISAGLITGLVLPLLHDHSLWAPGLFISALGCSDLLFPRQIAPLWNFLEKIGKTAAHYNSIFLLFLVYFLVITPAGFIFKWRCNFDKSRTASPSFYEKPNSREPSHMHRMF